MIGKLLWLLEVNVVFVGKTFIFEDTLISGIDQSLSLHDFFESKQRAKLLCNRLGHSLQLNFLLAARARHEGEGDPQSAPFVLQELHHAVSMEHVATREA